MLLYFNTFTLFMF